MKYTFSYDGYEIEFEVDKSIFNEAAAKEFLEFYSWSYDDDDDLILSALKKIALACFKESIDYSSLRSIIDSINDYEGYPKLNGPGIKLIKCDNIILDEFYLEYHN